MTNVKKISVNLTDENVLKLEMLKKESGMSQTELVNQAIMGVPVILLGNRKSIAECFFNLRQMMWDEDYEDFREEVDAVCLCLNSVMEKIAELQR